MGKSRARKFKAAAFSPTALVKQPEGTEENGDCKNVQAEDLVQNLQSPSAEVREFACASISTLVQQKQIIPAFLQRDVVRCLGPLLLDKCMSVRETAAGALRNLSTCGGFDVCDDMVTRDIMTPLVALLRECTTGLDVNMEPTMKTKSLSKDCVEDIATQAINVLWNVCESSSTALSIFNKESCVDVVLQCLSKFPSNMELAISAAYCLHTVTEDNTDLLNSFDASSLQTLESVMLVPASTMEMRQLQTMVAGSVWNLKAMIPSSSQADTMNAILRILSEALSVDAGLYILEMKGVEKQRVSAAEAEAETEEAAAILEEATLSEENGMVDGCVKGTNRKDCVDFIPPANEELRQVAALLVAQRIALEMIVNMCCSEDPSDDEWEALSSSDESEMCMENSMTDAGGQLLTPLCLSDEVHSALLTHLIPKKVFEKTAFPNSSAIETCRQASTWKPLIAKLYTVQHRALTCLHNILSVLDVEALGGAPALHELAQHLSGVVFTQSEQGWRAWPTHFCAVDIPKKDDFLEAASSAVRALLQTMAAKGLSQCITPDQIMSLSEACVQSSNSSARVNAVSIIGITGSVLAKSGNAEDTLKSIGNFLLGVSSNDPSLVVSGAALDAIFDVFADGDEAEKAAVEIKLLQNLKKIQSAFKTKGTRFMSMLDHQGFGLLPLKSDTKGRQREI
uniref:HEAT repeat containing 3 n=1 Tax=Leptobrachium leishanense TaxID=445787 RepID=A0A8C5PWI9_9ANUR